jgi:hypothetical protein
MTGELFGDWRVRLLMCGGYRSYDGVVTAAHVFRFLAP